MIVGRYDICKCMIFYHWISNCTWFDKIILIIHFSEFSTKMMHSVCRSIIEFHSIHVSKSWHWYHHAQATWYIPLLNSPVITTTITTTTTTATMAWQKMYYSRAIKLPYIHGKFASIFDFGVALWWFYVYLQRAFVSVPLLPAFRTKFVNVVIASKSSNKNFE
jgi:hypothetical protein